MRDRRLFIRALLWLLLTGLHLLVIWLTGQENAIAQRLSSAARGGRSPERVGWNEGLGGTAMIVKHGAALRGQVHGWALDRAGRSTASLGTPDLVRESLPQALAGESFIATALGDAAAGGTGRR